MPLSLLGCILLVLMLGWALYLLYEMRRRRELLRETEESCPPSPRHSGEIDVDRSLLFRPTASEGGTPYWLVFDTETFDLIPDEDPTEGYDDRPIALSWQLLDEHGVMLLEESYLLTRTEHLSPEATALHGVTDEDLRMRAWTPRAVYQLFLRDLSRAQVIVAHHLAFHRGILATDMQREGLGTELLLSAHNLCTMEWGLGLGFKRSASGQALYPRLTELFGQLYFARPSLSVRYTSKTLRDVRLCAAVLRRHPLLAAPEQ